ncbi:uncharacterized protein HD556DRAFT_1447966 [Suillus plorans]|uniref:Uncharacterized protein n=1 Tax=Suillus plorans TaxID=116603 RepID=A0A9P7DDS7_9AGAM|nr:uncharacterized protein HD556DRAFT_1447966 [Suillus plorans]KAG1788361.1 hypothetical protein HD556DRAFT_1447966 [Suillus plorans]
MVGIMMLPTTTLGMVMMNTSRAIGTLQAGHILVQEGDISMGTHEAVAFFRSDDPVLFPPGEFKHDIEDAN